MTPINQYFFILGKTPQLSKAEIYALFTKKGIDFTVLAYGIQYFIIQTNRELDITSFFRVLGGSIKAGQIILDIPLKGKSHFESIREIVTPTWLNKEVLSLAGQRINFGFSVYGSKKNNPFRLIRSLTKLGVSLKKEIRPLGKPVRFVNSRDPDLSAVVVDQNKLIANGADICFFLADQRTLIGKALIVQDYKRYSERDYGRPNRDAHSGMIPPKLARMMINLAGLSEKRILLDPFCGSGTILIEALDIGYQKVWGSDISETAVGAARQNIAWYLKHFGRKKVLFEIKAGDAKKLSRYYLKDSVAAIVTEPYLGPPLKGNENIDSLKKTVRLLEDIYYNSFKEFTRVLIPGGRIVVIFPIFLDRSNDIVKLDIVSKIEQLGFAEQKFPDYIKTNERGALEYSRPGQRVIREILVFSKN